MRYLTFGLLSLLSVTALKAQFTEIKIDHYDKKYPGKISVYRGENLLGLTDTSGFMSIEQNLYFSNLNFYQEGKKLDVQIVDSSSTIGIKKYSLEILPETTEEAVVKATRAGDREPHARSEVKKEDIAVQNLGRDLPVMLQYQPSVITTSDAGNGVGYTGIRVRGSDASRTNITINGVPINDAESQSTFWVNMPDLGSSVQQIQIQRGVGSSTNGAGAFGATVNIQTGTSFKPYGQISQSYGSFNTYKTTLAGGTGLVNNHWTMDLRLSQIHSDGFIDRAFSDLKSWMFSTAYFERKWSLKFLSFSGSEHTYQAWYGIPREKLYGPDSALKNQYERNLGYLYRNSSDSQNLFGSNPRTYNYCNYNNETDNYAQTHYHLYFNYKINKKQNVNVTLYKTLGKGYFEQFRPNDAVSGYGLQPFISGGDTFTNSDIIRRLWLDNTLTGINANWFYQGKSISITAGGGYNQYFGNHYGEIVWARIAPVSNYLQNYYSATGDKFDGNFFVKTSYFVDKNLQVSLDLQLRRVYHTGRGLDENLRPVQFTGDYLFFNPKFGISRNIGKGALLYTSVSIGNKEPSRSDFIDHGTGYTPKSEKLFDYEFGITKNTSRYAGTVNIYYMDYYNQLVLTGAVNDVGTPLRTNVESSYRAGIELSGVYKINRHFSVQGNLTLSENRIQKINIETTDYLDYSVSDTQLTNVPIAYSPATIAALSFVYTPGKDWQIMWNHKYTGRQYLDNTGNKDKSINSAYFSELWINKTFRFKGCELGIKFQILNMFNNLYNNNGYAYESYYGKGNLIREVFYFPSAPRNYQGGITLKF